MGKLGNKAQIIKLARDLHVTPGQDAASAIIAFCLRAVRQIRKEYTCDTLEKLLVASATHLSTRFIEIHTDGELAEIKKEFVDRSETGFARLDDLNKEVFAITFKLLYPRRWEMKYVSVIDCRAPREARAYFSKWHELAHLFTQTDQMRFVFTRTHAQLNIVDPEEALMEQIAGATGFLPEIIRPHIKHELSFDEIERLRLLLCPTASQTSSFIGFIKTWPKPALFLEAKIALRKGEERTRRNQRAFSFAKPPDGDLRAVMVVPNETGLSLGLLIHENMRVPVRSIIMRVFNDGFGDAEEVENLSMWKSSDGTVLPDLSVRVRAVKSFDSVRVLMTLN